jgi:hypothetical protein
MTHDQQARACLDRIDHPEALPAQLQIALAQVHAIIALVDTLDQFRNEYAAWQMLR